MDARFSRAAILAAAIVSMGAGYRTANFVVQAPSDEMAKEIGDEAERYRRELAIEWLGKPMPNWSRPCPIRARVNQRLGSGGATSFLFDRGEVHGWQMNIQGSRERILDSVLPHEVTHTIFASHFRQALPRWADEGACTTVEHISERAKQDKMLISFLKERRGISFSELFVMKEYPQDVLPLYSQGHSLARYLIAQGGQRKFIAFLEDGLEDENWPRVLRKHYGQPSLMALQTDWLTWVKYGSPMEGPHAPIAADTLVAQTDRSKRPSPNLIYRAQNEDADPVNSGKLVPVPRRMGTVAAKKPDKLAHRINGNRGEKAPIATSQPLPLASRAVRPLNRNQGASLPDATDENRVASASATPPLPTETVAQHSPAHGESQTPTSSAPVRQKILEWSRPVEPATHVAADVERPSVYDAAATRSTMLR